MQLYAKPKRRMARQLAGDLFLLAWVAGWALVARALRHAIDQLAVPARQSGNLASQMAQQMQDAQSRLGEVPGIGGSLGDPFGSLSGGLQQVAAQSQQQITSIHHLALAGGWLCFLVPTLTLVARWLPGRVRFVQQAGAARQFVDADEDLDLFALRAMANVPMAQLARITPDPVGEWRRGNREVVRRLAALELERTGLALPAPVRPTSPPRGSRRR